LLAVAAVPALLLTYNVSLNPLRADRSALELGAADTRLLVGSGHSPLSDARTLLPKLETSAANIAQLADAPLVQRKIGNAIHVPPDQVGISVSVTRNQSGAHQFGGKEVQRVMQITATKKNYQVTVLSSTLSFIITIYTEARTGSQAAAMANATAAGIIDYVRKLRGRSHSNWADRVTVSQLAPATSGELGTRAGIEAFALLTACFWLILLVPLLAWRRGRRRRRRAVVSAGAG
jgi:hypothetical protein